jgi:homoserine/homoserine lactone efflux protein
VTFQTWLLFCATETILCLTPGPAVLLVVSLALARGARAGLGGSLGILAANAAYFLLSGTGLGAVLLASWQLFVVIKWLGAAYLVWMGVRMVLRPAGVDAGPRATPAASSRPPVRTGTFWQGFVTQAANPKALIFFTALLPQFIDPRQGVATQVAILGVSSVLIEFAVLGIYVLACDRARGWAGDSRLAVGLQRAGGALLIVAGLRLAAVRTS